MAFEVRMADLEADREAIINCLFRHLTPHSDNRRFDWLYCQNPFGRAKCWVASEGGELVAVLAAFPREVYGRGGRQQAFVLGDFCIDPHHRSLGPAIRLQRAGIEALVDGGACCWYDFPSRTMTSVYHRIGLSPAGNQVRMALPIRLDKKVAQRVAVRPVAQVLSAIGNAALALRSRRPLKDEIEVTEQTGNVGREFTAFAEQVNARWGTCVVRSSEYLNWRYRSHPYAQYKIAVARRGAELAGYIVFAQEGDMMRVVDLLVGDDPSAFEHLLYKVVTEARAEGVSTVSFPVPDSHAWIQRLQAFGFRPREATPVMIQARPQFSGQWLLLDGDRES